MGKILIRAIVIVALVAALVAWLLAWQAESRACVGTGFFDLKIRDQDEAWRDGVNRTWTAPNMRPGEEYPFEESFVSLRNRGLLCADHLEIGMEYFLAGPGGASAAVMAGEMARMMTITRLEYGNSDWSIDLLTGKVNGSPPTPGGFRPGDWTVEDRDRDGRITFRDLSDDPLDDLPPPQSWMGESRCPVMRMGVRFAAEADDRFMGVGLSVCLVYTLNQCSGQ